MAAHAPPDSSPLVYDIVQFPVVCTTVIVCIFTFAWVNRDAAARVASCAFSFKSIVTDGQFDRVMFAQICHESAVHLALNLSSLLSLRHLESTLGPLVYLKLVLVLMLLSAAIMLLSSFVLYKHTRQPSHLTSSSIGYSCVLFGMTSFQSLSHASSSVSIFGLRLPALFAPFLSLIMVSLLVPNASFSGHLGGIFAGFLTAALSLHTALPLSFLATFPLLCIVSKYARWRAGAVDEQQRQWDSV
jgi:membrane associated rhomboid family serine protease